MRDWLRLLSLVVLTGLVAACEVPLPGDDVADPPAPSEPADEPAASEPSADPPRASASDGAESCETPAADVRVEPGESIQEAVDANSAGTSFLLGAGVHRLASVEAKDGNTFSGEIGEDCTRETILNGARLLEDFDASGGMWVAGGQDQTGDPHGECVDDRPRCGYPHDLYYDGEPLRHVSSVDEVGEGSWFFDYDADQVFLGSDPNGHTVELGTTRHAFGPDGDDITIRGLVIEKYANPAQAGAIADAANGEEGPPNSGWVVEDNEIRLNHGVGVRAGADTQIRNNFIHDNGQMGYGGSGPGVAIEGNEVARNNYAGFDPGWEAGGSKLAFTQQAIVRGNCVHHNTGPGIWVDIENTDTLIEDNISFENTQMGVFFEISQGAEIRNNRVGHNGADNPGWLYGANILISTSTNADVHHNYVEVAAGFGNGIAVIWQDRPPFEGTGSTVHDNETTFLGEAGQSGVAADFEPATTEAFETNSFRDNTYHVTNEADQRFAWDNTAMTFADFQAAGQDSGGTLDTNVSAQEWACRP